MFRSMPVNCSTPAKRTSIAACMARSIGFCLPEVLERVGGNQVLASQLLGIARSTFRTRISDLGMMIAKRVVPDSTPKEWNDAIWVCETKQSHGSRTDSISVSCLPDEPADREQNWRALYPFTSRYLDHGGVRQHYLDEGAGRPLLLVHGNPTWSFHWRNLITGLRRDFDSWPRITSAAD